MDSTHTTPRDADNNDEGSSPPANLDPNHVITASTQDRAPSKSLLETPLFWSSKPRHERSVSNVSQQSLGLPKPGQIRLEDHSEESDIQSQSCWAKSASIDEYVLVSGATGIGAYVVWHCTVQTLKGGDLALRKRYCVAYGCRMGVWDCVLM